VALSVCIFLPFDLPIKSGQLSLARSADRLYHGLGEVVQRGARQSWGHHQLAVWGKRATDVTGTHVKQLDEKAI
jgi:hypothetical protein